ncbi:hypothetical protein NW769_003235 [Fusarium oxysporum]|nr:hypothetical protein NW769_003235 [Fusarium oxysporum]
MAPVPAQDSNKFLGQGGGDGKNNDTKQNVGDANSVCDVDGGEGAPDRGRRFYRQCVAFIIAAIVIATFRGGETSSTDSPAYGDEVDYEERNQDRTTYQPDDPLGEVNDWHDKGGDNKQAERVYPRAPVKLNVRARGTDQKSERKGTEDIRDG